ncbi:Conserved oligomeric Golgi complex subunit 3 [Cladobotryum mycophilum]|uniref:Conserved oligomeric Golgi complex subunit 3 n=1 Tax=Cladobotryum mycophilum TaxID=491253 RepID=A0ABR0SVB8_9HYPO
MYEDGWYSIVPEITNKKPATGAQSQGHLRKESLLQQSNASGKGGANAIESLDHVLEEAEDPNTPPEPTLIRRAASYSDFYHVVKAQLSKGSQTKSHKKIDKRDRGWDALALFECNGKALVYDDKPALPTDSLDSQLLEESQQEYLLYWDQLKLTERHLDGLINDANEALKLLTTLSNSFQSVEAQTSTFQSQCEELVTEQTRLEKLANEVGTDLHYYAYLETATRRLNAPGASRLVDDDDFGEMVANIDSCIAFMNSHENYRERDSYLARFNALLTKALHLLDHGFTSRLEKVSSDIARQIAATKSESARHALAYGRFEETMAESYSLLPNVQKVVRCAYDQYGQPVENTTTTSIYATASSNMFRTYLSTRDRDLKLITQHELEEYQKEVKSMSVETASRNFIKQLFEKIYHEDGLFVQMFGVEPVWSTSPDSAFQAIKAINTTMVHPGHLIPLATNVQSVLQNAKLQEICGVVGWLASEYAIAMESDEEDSPSFKKYREYAARLLADHLWSFTDNAFEAEITKSISRASVQDSSLKISLVVDGVASSNAYPLVKKAIELLAMFDQAMPKERSAKNSSVVFKIIRETIQVLQRAEARIKSLKTDTDSDLFMIKNLLIIKNELVSLEIGDIRSQPSMQHFGQIWDTLSPQSWVGFFGGIISSQLWSRGAPAVTTKALTADDISEQLDELLRQSIYAFTKRWGSLLNDSQSRKAGAKPIAKIEAELEKILQSAFSNQPEVIAKLKEAIQLNAQAQNDVKDTKNGSRRY